MSRSYFAGRRVAHHGREAFEETTEARSSKAFVTQPDTESLNGVGDCACVKRPELVDLVRRYWSVQPLYLLDPGRANGVLITMSSETERHLLGGALLNVP